ncbi:NRDE family protein [Hydrogenophaga sp. A37]|uniref:NRDE family protein n=1 Tax=Hydrogenophaga sp. A37 TaxID=1945864 RepID=UPI0009874157|nr:NRDE family protein [Hydrogenophaga sp. A37]OOG85229.1 hypothetical protein B0E41_09060 [Hydrogenophaga sp. A37]
MCLIAFAIDADPACPLLIAANRDEFFDRPTEPLHRWALPDGSFVLAGRDLRDGGTWLGVGESGRVAMLTNVRNAHPGPGRRSRGELPARWLQTHVDAEKFIAGIDPAAHGGFNLIVGDFHAGFWAWITNRDPARPHEDGSEKLHSQRLAPGIYGVSNAALDTPWPKTQRLKSAVGEALGAPSMQDQHRVLREALADRITVAAQALPQTGVPTDIEQALSSPFVDMLGRGYGTRSSLIARVTHPGDAGGPWQVRLDEWTHRAGGVGPHRWSGDERRTHRLHW